MLKWILEHIGIVVVAVVFLTQIIRALLQSKKSASKDVAKPNSLEEERRVREVQEQNRRQIAARRGVTETAEPPVVASPPELRPPQPRPQTTQMPEPFGGPLGRMLEELQRRAEQQHAPPPRPAPPMLARSHRAELERQEQLADELAAAEEARRVVQRRAAHLAADKGAEAQSEPKLRTAARDDVLKDLHDVGSLRRAFVLREVLGTPVGLR